MLSVNEGSPIELVQKLVQRSMCIRKVVAINEAKKTRGYACINMNGDNKTIMIVYNLAKLIALNRARQKKIFMLTVPKVTV